MTANGDTWLVNVAKWLTVTCLNYGINVDSIVGCKSCELIG
jgi:hypothetical protein